MCVWLYKTSQFGIQLSQQSIGQGLSLTNDTLKKQINSVQMRKVGEKQESQWGLIEVGNK